MSWRRRIKNMNASVDRKPYFQNIGYWQLATHKIPPATLCAISLHRCLMPRLRLLGSCCCGGVILAAVLRAEHTLRFSFEPEQTFLAPSINLEQHCALIIAPLIGNRNVSSLLLLLLLLLLHCQLRIT